MSGARYRIDTADPRPTALYVPGEINAVLVAVLASGQSADDEQRIAKAIAAIPGVCVVEPISLFNETQDADRADRSAAA